MKKLFGPKAKATPSELKPFSWLNHVPENDVSGPAHLQPSEDHWVVFQDQGSDTVDTGLLLQDHSRHLSITSPSPGASNTALNQPTTHAASFGDVTHRLNQIPSQLNHGQMPKKKKEPSAVGSMSSSDPGQATSRSNASPIMEGVEHENSLDLLRLGVETDQGSGLRFSEPKFATRKGPRSTEEGKKDPEYIGKKGERVETERMIDYLTGNGLKDWPLTLEICKRASASFAASRDASRALRSVLQYGQPVAQLSTARLLAIMIQKCTTPFIVEASRPKFLRILEDAILSKETPGVVRERLLYALAGAAFTYPNSGYHRLWRQVKPSDKPDEGIPFDRNGPMLDTRAEPIRERVMSNDEMWQWFLQECETSKGDAKLLNEALALSLPNELSGPIIIEWYRKCRSSQDFIVAQIPWATSQVESSHEGLLRLYINTEDQEKPRPIPTSKEETLLAAFLSANEELLEVLRIHDELQRLGALEQEKKEIEQPRVTKTDSNQVPNPFISSEELSQMVKPDGGNFVEGSTRPSHSPFPPRSSSLDNLQSLPPRRPLPPRPSRASDSDTQTSSPHSISAPLPIARKTPQSKVRSSQTPSPEPPTSRTSFVSGLTLSGIPGPKKKHLANTSYDSLKGSIDGTNDYEDLSHPVVIPEDEALSRLYNDVLAGFTSPEGDTASVSSSLEAEDISSAGVPLALPEYDPHKAEPENDVDGNRPSSRRFQEGFSDTGLLSARPSLRAPSKASVDLPGKTVRFTNMESHSPVSSKAHDANINLGSIPNLTGRITIVKGRLLAGGFCDIFSGELMSERGTESVAMKMLRVFNTEAHVVKAKKKFRGEVNVWRTLRHAYVLPFYGTCELDESRLFMVSPWAQGGNSLEYLRRNPFADRGRLLWQTASALEYLHSGRDAPQVVHGDLKADNVLISAEGDALLCDFGLSRHVEEIISKSGSSSAGRAGGHARFMAPELLLPPKGLHHARGPTRESDVFAFASLMLQIYTEQLPFCDLFEAQAILKIASGHLPPRPVEPIILERGITDQIWAVMMECWQFEPPARPRMAEVRQRIDVL